MRTYKIMALGVSGSGKTVFLGSLYHRLFAAGGGLNLFLKPADENQRLELIRLFNQVEGGPEWPRGNRSVTTWKFTCTVQTLDGSRYDAIEFIYLDYPGGDLREGNLSTETVQTLISADAFLILLDGAKILALMEKKEAADTFLTQDLRVLLGLTQLSNRAQPIHFVLTKWDLLEARKQKFRDIRSRLLEDYQFNVFVQNNRNTGRPIRLIPVSSVGTGFATLQPDGSMQKNLGVTPRPFQVELPLICVLPDTFQFHFEEALSKRKASHGSNSTMDNQKIPNLERLSLITALALRFSVPFLVGMGATILRFPVIDFEKSVYYKLLINLILMIDVNGQEAQKRLERFKKEREKSLKAVHDEKTALKHAVDSFVERMAQLEIDFPGSDLSQA